MLPLVFLSLVGLALADLDHSKFKFSLREYAHATILRFYVVFCFCFFCFVLRLNVQVNHLSVMSGQSHRFPSINSAFGE